MNYLVILFLLLGISFSNIAQTNPTNSKRGSMKVRKKSDWTEASTDNIKSEMDLKKAFAESKLKAEQDRLKAEADTKLKIEQDRLKKEAEKKAKDALKSKNKL